ncbi:YHS domain-containing protein [Halomonas organivorans]
MDPVCGRQIDFTSSAMGSEYQGKRYYLCSIDCRKRFEAEPERFVRGMRDDFRP